jgi:hypothetical protein
VSERETVLSGLHPSKGVSGGDILGGMDDIQRRFLADRLLEDGRACEDHEPGRLPYVCHGCALVAAAEAIRPRAPSPTYWPGEAPGGLPGHTDAEETGPIGAGTPHARMQWFWERMRPHEALVEELTGWSPVSSRYRFEEAVADAFDRLASLRRRNQEVKDALEGVSIVDAQTVRRLL